MRIHLKIIAFISLFFGAFLLLGFILGHYAFFTSEFFSWDSSVLDGSFSFFDRIGNVFKKYREFFGLYGINPLLSLLWIIFLLALGIGLLKNKEWARKLGFIFIALNIAAFGLAIYDGNLYFGHILQMLFTFYLTFVFTSPKIKEILN